MSAPAVALSPVALSPIPGTRPKLLIYSEYSVLLDGVKSALDERFDITVANSVPAFLTHIHDWFDTVVLDVGSTDQASLRAVELELSRRGLPVVLLVTDSKGGVEYTPRFFSPMAVCCANEPLAQIAATFEAVADGACLGTAPNETDAVNGKALTDRQTQVLRLVSQGLSAKEIANGLNISVRTAEFHRAAIMTRLDLHTTAELTRFALVSGLHR